MSGEEYVGLITVDQVRRVPRDGGFARRCFR
jgi:hypothetical protein